MTGPSTGKDQFELQFQNKVKNNFLLIFKEKKVLHLYKIFQPGNPKTLKISNSVFHCSRGD